MILATLLALLALDVLPGQTAGAQMFDNIISLNFDIDGNILNLDAPAVLYHKRDGSELILPHQEFAAHYEEVGKAQTKYEAYEIRHNKRDPMLSTFRFTDDGPRNHLLDQIEEARLARRGDLFASQYARYFHAMRNPRTRAWVHWVTARGLSPEYLRESQEHLVFTGLAPAHHDVGTLIPVSYLHGPTGHLDADEGKAETHVSVLDEIESHVVTRRTHLLWDDSGLARKPMHYFEFSDDSPGILKTVRDRVAEMKRFDRWPHVKIRLHYTGKPSADWAVRDVVVNELGELRPTQERERREIDQFVGISPFLDHAVFCGDLLAK